MLGLRHKYSRGDTLIEVLFSVAVFSLVAVGSLTLMNQGSNTSQRALEISLVRQQIDSQAEALRFLHDAYVVSYKSGQDSYSIDTPSGQWRSMVRFIDDADIQSASNFGDQTECPRTAPTGSFIINTELAQFVDTTKLNFESADTYSRVIYDDLSVLSKTRGIWVEAIASDSNITLSEGEVRFIDFHIRACWDSVGLSVPMTIGTIVRLYEP